MKQRWFVFLMIAALVAGVAGFMPAGASARPFASPFAPGNLVVYRVGDGVTALASGVAAPVFLDEYTSAGALVQTIPLPTTTVGSQRRLTAAGTASTEGLLTISGDLNYLLLTGYDAAIGATGLTTSASATTNRVIARVDATANIDTSTALTDFSTGASPRSVASTNGTDLWVGGGAGGVRYTTLGSTTSTQLAATPTNIRQVKIGNGQIYISSGGAGFVGLSTVGTGTPTTSGQTSTLLPGLPGTGSPYSFYLADLNAGVAGFDTLYLTEDTLAGQQGIRKYSLVAGSWVTNTPTILLPTARGLTGVHSGSIVTLFATNGVTLSQVIDTAGYNAAPVATITTLASAGTNRAFRGVAFTPSTSPTAITLTTFSGRTPTDIGSIMLIPLAVAALLIGGWLLRRRTLHD